MRASVRDAFVKYSIEHEGYTPFMYCDTLNLVTTGIGNLVDMGARNGTDTSITAMAPALRLPWVHKHTGEPATQQEIADAWIKVKMAGLSQHGGFAYESVTDLILTKEAIADLVHARLDLNDKILTQGYPSYEQWPADAQFAINSMAWACGPSFHFPRFHAALGQSPPDFTEAGVQSEFHGGGKLDDPRSRNAQNAKMFMLAQMAQTQGWDFDVVYFLQGAPTQPEGVEP